MHRAVRMGLCPGGYPYRYTDLEIAQIALDYVNARRREILGEGYDLVRNPDLVQIAKERAASLSGNYHTKGYEIINDNGSNFMASWEVVKEGPSNLYSDPNLYYFGYGCYRPEGNTPFFSSGWTVFKATY